MAGIDFFYLKDDVFITVKNTNDVTLNKELFDLLIGITVKAKYTAQFYFERVIEEKIKVGDAIDNKYYYAFPAKDAVSALKEIGRDTDIWEKIDPDVEVIFYSTCCEETTRISV